MGLPLFLLFNLKKKRIFMVFKVLLHIFLHFIVQSSGISSIQSFSSLNVTKNYGTPYVFDCIHFCILFDTRHSANVKLFFFNGLWCLCECECECVRNLCHFHHFKFYCETFLKLLDSHVISTEYFYHSLSKSFFLHFC